MHATLSALAEPNRFAIVELLKEGPRTVGEIGEGLSLRQPQVSKHLKVLKGAGLVAVHPVKNRRIYVLSPEPLRQLHSWCEGYEALWSARHDAMDALLAELTAERDDTDPG